eukprot:CAMPEP_0198289850 /NCGR_PEP_ID=MMETSP1449-20131203/7907_1 /TAXON_ID=420275 /ORGANISM="Attheya septentrionalis, Strain CCMP2084" /LENGTH=412 /DNA_ID=CAMNT_0043988253 /DNA_START=63 /DNA_END=1301 /DNA_ORIENTATION=-
MSSERNEPRDGWNHDVLPDLPIGRSVSMMQRPLAEPVYPRAPVSSSQFGKLPPKLTRPFSKSLPSMPSPSHSSTSASTSSQWIVSDKALKVFPPFCPLERSHVHIQENAEVVAKRITECLQCQSIAATYNNDEASAVAKMSDHTCFHICFFRACDDDGKPREGFMIVELQRRRGSCFSFRQASRVILRAAQGEGQESTLHSTVEPRSVPACVVEAAALDPQDTDKTAGYYFLHAAGVLLSKESYDTRSQCLDTLLHMTTPSLTSQSVASQTSAFIVQGMSETSGVSSMIKSLVLHSKVHDQDKCTSKSQNEEMRSKAITLLGNAFEHASLLAPVDDELLSALVEELACAGEQPHNAYRAVRCLKALAATSDSLKEDVKQICGAQDIDAAIDSGHRQHALLEKESQEFMLSLQ